MTEADLRFLESTASAAAVSAHLKACDAAFVPKLSERLDIDAYAEKIVRNAVTFEAWQEDLLVGLVAAYINDPVRQTGYVTNVTVEPVLMGRHVAATLFESCLARARGDGFETIALEVGQENQRAIRFYEKFGFRILAKKATKLEMSLNLRQQPKASNGGSR